MSDFFLPGYYDNALYRIEKGIKRLKANSMGFREVMDFCADFRMIGICSILLTAGTAEYLKSLCQSAKAFVYFLENKGIEDIVLSQCRPLFDSIACGRTDLVEKMASMLACSFNKDYEYIEDYYYYKYVLQLSCGANDALCSSIVREYEEKLEDGEDANFRICKGLDLRDEDCFFKGMRDFLGIYEQRFRVELEAEVISQDLAATEGKLSIEAISLLRLAESRGLNVEEDYLFAPGLARKAGRGIHVDGDWMSI